MGEYLKKDIIIYGTGLNAVKFISQNRLNKVCFFIEEKKNLNSFHGKNVMRLENAICFCKGKSIIVASSPNTYYDIKQKLESYELKEFEDFIYWELYCKKIAVVYGNCHMGPLKEALQSCNSFNKEYGFYPLKPIQVIKQEGGINNYDLSVLNYCDLFLHQSIREDNRYGLEYSSKYIIKKLPISCKIIAVPNLYGLPQCLFPNNYLGESSICGINNLFPLRDSFIERLYLDGNTIGSVVSMVKEENIISAIDIRRAFKCFLDKVKEREQEWDIKIAEWIGQNYRTKKLFYDMNHPTGEVFKYIGRSVLELLGIEKITTDIFGHLSELDAYEVPLYSAVKVALGIEYDTTYMRLYSKNKFSNSAMDLETYIEQYIDWYFKVWGK